MTRAELFFWLAMLAAAMLVARSGNRMVSLRPLGSAAASASAEIEASLAAMRAQSGFRVELVASEPMVIAPVFGAFDEDGRLWICEMQSYMPDLAATGEAEPRNRVVILEDTNNDGRMDRSTVFLEGLVLPRGVAPCHGGALVIEPPHLYFCKDLDGDGNAMGPGEKRKLLDGFEGIENPEHAGNGPILGLDGWWTFSQHNVDVWFDGAEVRTRPVPVIGQWGLTRDDEGRVYYTPNSTPLIADLWPKWYAGRNLGLAREVPPAGLGENIGASGDAAPEITHPIHPTPGVNRGYQDGVLRADRTLARVTAACGPAFYRADALGPGFRGSVFIAEPAGNLVKRLLVEFDGSGRPRAVNAYPDSEFLASTDERFRPVQCLIGPDGALYVLDIARGLIQHKTYVTEFLARQVTERGLESPLDRGRIWRIVPENWTQPPRPALSQAPDAEVIDLLTHPDGWWRDTAQRLVIERQPGQSALNALSLRTDFQGDAAALTVAATLRHAGFEPNSLTPIEAAKGARQLVAALRDAADGLDEPGLRQRVGELALSEEPSVRVQAVLTLGERDRPDVLPDMARAALVHAGDRIFRHALVSGLSGREIEFLSALRNAGEDRTAPSAPDRPQRDLLSLLTRSALASVTPRTGERFLDEIALLGLNGDPRAEALRDAVRDWQRLSSSSPRTISLIREPSNWIDAAEANADSESGARWRESLTYMDWPNRPPVQRRIARELSQRERESFDRGRIVYTQCVACHQASGRGAAGIAPSLVGSPRVLGDERSLIKILLHGLQRADSEWSLGAEGSMDDPRQDSAEDPPADADEDAPFYTAGMPGMPPTTTADEIADVLTYVRRSWGNAAAPVGVAIVRQVREQVGDRESPYTPEELDKESRK